MLNDQKLIIFCVLIAAALVAKSAKVYIYVDARYQHFVVLVKKVDAEPGLIKNMTIRFESLDRLNAVSHDFKLACLKAWDDKLRRVSLAYDPMSTDVLMQLSAYRALDTVLNQNVQDLKSLIKTKAGLLQWQFDSMLGRGNIIQFIAFRERPNITKDQIKSEIKSLQKKYKEITVDEATIWAILYNYDWGTIGDHYPRPKSSRK